MQTDVYIKIINEKMNIKFGWLDFDHTRDNCFCLYVLERASYRKNLLHTTELHRCSKHNDDRIHQ